MNKTFLLTIAQSNNTGSFNVRVGGNANLGLTLTTTQIGNLVSDVDSGGVAAITLPLSFDFGIHKLFSISAGFRVGKWINEDPNDTDIEVREAKTRTANIGFKFFPVSKKNFNLYLGYDFGLSGFSKEKYTKSTVTTENQKWGGTSHYLNIGTNFYFGKGFGMYYQMGYTGYNLDLQEYSASNPLISLDYIKDFNFTANSIVKGAQIELGFCYKFGNADN